MTHALTAMGAMDPERLSVRIGLLEDEDERDEVARIVRGGFACLSRIQSIDFRALERSTGGSGGGVWDAAREPVTAMWLAVEELNGILAPLIEAHEAKQQSTELDFELDLGEADDEAAPVRETGPMTPLERIGETAWATCFVLNGEIQGFRKRLPALTKLRDGWELVSELQDHVGHVKAAVNAILTGVYSSLPSALEGATEAEQSLELMASLELRIRVFELRDQVHRVERHMVTAEPHQWEKFLRLALQLIEGFMFGPGFAWMRAGDKRTFITQHHALSEILELYSPLRAVPAKNIVSNLARYLEALEVINQREILVEHDREKLEQVVSRLESARASRDTTRRRESLAGALAALAELEGRDRDLDRLIAQTLEPGTPVPEGEIHELASSLLAKLRSH